MREQNMKDASWWKEHVEKARDMAVANVGRAHERVQLAVAGTVGDAMLGEFEQIVRWEAVAKTLGHFLVELQRFSAAPEQLASRYVAIVKESAYHALKDGRMLSSGPLAIAAANQSIAAARDVVMLLESLIQIAAT